MCHWSHSVLTGGKGRSVPAALGWLAPTGFSNAPLDTSGVGGQEPWTLPLYGLQMQVNMQVVWVSDASECASRVEDGSIKTCICEGTRQSASFRGVWERSSICGGKGEDANFWGDSERLTCSRAGRRPCLWGWLGMGKCDVCDVESRDGMCKIYWGVTQRHRTRQARRMR